MIVKKQQSTEKYEKLINSSPELAWLEIRKALYKALNDEETDQEFIQNLKELLKNLDEKLKPKKLKIAKKVKEASIEDFIELINNHNFFVRLYSSLFAAKFQKFQFASAIEDRLKKEFNPFVQATLISSLAKLNYKAAIPTIKEFLKSPDERVRSNAYEALFSFGITPDEIKKEEERVITRVTYKVADVNLEPTKPIDEKNTILKLLAALSVIIFIIATIGIIKMKTKSKKISNELKSISEELAQLSKEKKQTPPTTFSKLKPTTYKAQPKLKKNTLSNKEKLKIIYTFLNKSHPFLNILTISQLSDQRLPFSIIFPKFSQNVEIVSNQVFCKLITKGLNHVFLPSIIRIKANVYKDLSCKITSKTPKPLQKATSLRKNCEQIEKLFFAGKVEEAEVELEKILKKGIYPTPISSIVKAYIDTGGDKNLVNKALNNFSSFWNAEIASSYGLKPELFENLKLALIANTPLPKLPKKDPYIPIKAEYMIKNGSYELALKLLKNSKLKEARALEIIAEAKLLLKSFKTTLTLPRQKAHQNFSHVEVEISKLNNKIKHFFKKYPLFLGFQSFLAGGSLCFPNL